MQPKDQALRNKQRERQERGEDFQAEIRASWQHIPHCWRVRIQDAGGGTRPGDELTVLSEVNILAELKRTEGQKFQLSFLRSDQLTGLIDFDRVIPRNFGLVYISFHNQKKDIDETYAVRLATAIRYMQRSGIEYIHLEDFRRKLLPCCELPRTESGNYDMKGLVACCKSL